MRVLTVVKTTDGAAWAAYQARELVRRGIEVHVALPADSGSLFPVWETSGAKIHVTATGLPVDEPWAFARRRRGVLRLVNEVSPDLIHSHFVTTTLMLRLSLGRDHPIPRLFQVPGPLHLEHAAYRVLETATAGPADSWICSSRYIRDLYEGAGIPRERLFLSYYGTDTAGFGRDRTGRFRRELGIADDEIVVGNINYIYPPKYYLGQTRGIKGHEDVIDALGIVVRRRRGVTGVLAGGAWGGAGGYERRLRRKAQRAGAGKILMPGYLSGETVREAWADFDVAVHVPLSENCGGVLEPLLAGVPTIAGRVGGLAEVVMEGVTGRLVPIGRPDILAGAIGETIEDRGYHLKLAMRGKALVEEMFDYRRTAGEIADIYRYVLDPSSRRPAEFDSVSFLKTHPVR